MKTIFKTAMLFLHLLFSLSIYSQLNIGIVGSMHISTAKPEAKYFGENIYATHKFGFLKEETKISYGVTIHKTFRKLFFLNEFNYRQSIAYFHLEDFALRNDQNTRFSEKSQLINFPIIAGINIFKNIKIGAGTNFNYVIESEDNVMEGNLFTKKDKSFQTGMLLYGSYKLCNRVLFSIKYERMFDEIGNLFYFNNNTTRISSRLDRISFGISIFPARLD